MRRLLLIAPLLLSACLPREAAELFLLRGHFDLVQDVSYGSDVRQRLDVYRPRRGRRAAAVIVFLYGGRWQDGSKREYRLLGDAATRRGLLAVVPDYRLYPQVNFPGWVEDAARAVRWVSDNIKQFGGDPSQIFVVGHSSGGHTAALLALDERYLRDAGVSPTAVRGFVSLAGPVATQWTDADVQMLMGPREQWASTYPLKQVGRPMSPILLLHGMQDRTVAVGNSTRLAARIRERGGCARAMTYRSLGHVGIVLALALPQLDIAPVLEDVVRFIRQPLAACDWT